MSKMKDRIKSTEDTFEVERILEHRTNKLGTTLYLIKWLGFDSKFNTWEPEANLIGSEDLLIEFKLANSIPHHPLSQIEFDDEEPLTGNSIDMPRVLEYINTISKFRAYRPTIKVTEFVDRLDEENGKIYVLLHRAHFFVIGHFSCNNTIVIDGANATDDRFLMEELEKLTDHKLVQVRFGQQSGIDHCGASAIVIVLELIRMHNRGEVPKGKIQVPGGTHKFLITKLLRNPAEELNGWKSINEIELPTCSKCHKRFRKRGRKGMLIHERRCTGEISV